jgi:uncharacterized protein (DUF433 family)
VNRTRSHGIERVAGRCGGKPVIEGTRIPADAVFRAFGSGWSMAYCAEQWHLTVEQVEAAVRFAGCLRARRPWAVRLSRLVLMGPNNERAPS